MQPAQQKHSKGGIRSWTRAAAIAGSVGIAMATCGAAAAAVPSDLAARMVSAAAVYRGAMQRAQSQSSNPNLAYYAAVNARMDQDAGEADMASAVIDGIIRNPSSAQELTAAAAMTAPQLAQGMARRVSQAFPAFSNAIYAAAAQPQSIRVTMPTTAPAAPAAFGSIPQAAPSAPLSTPGPAIRATPLPPAAAPAPRPAPPPAVSQSSAPAASDEDAAIAAMQVASVGPPPINDPLEGFNRVMFEINDVLDRFLLRPIAWTYGFIMPDPAKESVRNVVKNLGAPVVLANNLLQFEFGNAADTMTRFVVNSTAGLAGMFDVASDLGFKERPADFGQTLHVYGVSAGPYLVLPFLGPSTPRHAVGQFADGFFEPLSYALDTEQNLAMTGAKIVIARESFLTELDNLRADSLDYYAALRSLYFQNRQKTLNGGDDGQDRRMDLLFETTK